MNANELLSKIVLKGVTVPELAKDLNFAKTTIYRKVRGKTEFSGSEISKIIDYLGLTPQEVVRIFFNQKVS